MRTRQDKVDDSFRAMWRWDTGLNRNQDSLRDNPEYLAIEDWLRTDMASQLEASLTFSPN